MKGKTNIWELRDISGTVCVSNAYLTYLRAAKCSAYLVRISQFFIAHVNHVAIAKIIKKTETDMEIVFSLSRLWFRGGLLMAEGMEIIFSLII